MFNLNVVKGLLLGFAICASMVLSNELLQFYSSEPQLVEQTVMITNFQKRSGGTGWVYHVNEKGSIIITNKHVCGLFDKEGGIVIGYDKIEHNVVGIITSDEHDLCLVKIAYRFDKVMEIADKPSEPGDKIITSGHPGLRPTTTARGMNLGLQIASILKEMKPCKDPKPEEVVYCVFLGGIPVIENYEAIATDAPTYPGSSGSMAVNSSGEVIGVVFAGNQTGMGFLVPLEALKSFIYDGPLWEREFQQPWKQPAKEEKPIPPPDEGKIKTFCTLMNTSVTNKLCTSTLNNIMPVIDGNTNGNN